MTDTIPKAPDADVTYHGSIVLVRPISRDACAWIAENVGEAQWYGDSLVVEPRYVADLIAGMQGDGLEVM